MSNKDILGILLTEMKNDVYAFIIPLLPEHIERIYSGRSVIAKFLPKPGYARKFRRNNFVLFYETRKNKEVVGQGLIEKMSFIHPKQIIERYGKSFFLNEKELYQYVNKFPGRENKNPLVIELKDIIMYPNPIRCKTNPTIAGIFLTKEQLIKFVNSNENQEDILQLVKDTV